jgi:mono/diheme cytochrome c family protein
MMQTLISFERLIPFRALLSVALLVSPIMASGQQSQVDPAKRGEGVFAAHCSFCHGDAGSGHNAPRLAERRFDGQHIENVIREGVTGTAMAAWAQLLSAEDLNGVIAYVKSLNGIVATPNGNASPVLSAEAARGRELFRDATRELGACSNCHAVDGHGVNIAPPMKEIPSAATALRRLATPRVKTVRVNGEDFPALVAMQSRDQTKVYDLTTVPPVMRTFATSAVQVTDGSTWQHAAVVGKTYSDQELELVLGYLRAAEKP